MTLKKELALQHEQQKGAILDVLSRTLSYDEAAKQLDVLEKSQTIKQKLLVAFPGFFGRFVCLHFARFLNEPIQTQEQQEAYVQIVAFLDGVAPITFPKEVRAFLEEGVAHMQSQQLQNIMDTAKQSIEQPERFLAEQKQMIEQYLIFKQSDAYKNSVAYQAQELIHEFQRASGYLDVFLPAMKRLSPSYAAYYRDLERANQQLLEQYPEIATLSKQ